MTGCGRKIGPSHKELVAMASRWLRGTMRCHPVFRESTSCEEAPDAIGWRSKGSIVVECKTSIEDFLRDKAKYRRYKDPVHGWCFKPRGRIRAFKEKGYIPVEVPRMGTQRFIFCAAGVVSPELLARHASDHGLLYVKGRTVKVVIPAPVREAPSYESEIRMLRLHALYQQPTTLVEMQPQLFEPRAEQMELEK